MPLWLPADPLVLASKSAARRALLDAAGIPLEVRPAEIDERATETGTAGNAEAEAEAAAALLARAKALAVAAQMPGRLVLGADQTLALDARRFSKPADRTGAAEQLRTLRGQTHALHSAVALARDGKILFEHSETARLTMRAFSDTFLDDYLATAGSAVTASVGGYQLEGAGIQLFERIEGDYFTILGLPLLPLLAFLRREGWLAA
jgi:septum formation protein